MSLNTIQDQEIKGRLSQTTEEEQYYEADYHHSPLSSSSADNRDQYPQHFTFDVSREQTNIPRNSSEPVLQHYFLPVQTNLGHLETDSDNKKKKKPKKFGSIKSLFNLKWRNEVVHVVNLKLKINFSLASLVDIFIINTKTLSIIK